MHGSVRRLCPASPGIIVLGGRPTENPRVASAGKVRAAVATKLPFEFGGAQGSRGYSSLSWVLRVELAQVERRVDPLEIRLDLKDLSVAANVFALHVDELPADCGDSVRQGGNGELCG